MTKNNEKGFTLLELLITIIFVTVIGSILLGLVGTLAGPLLWGHNAEANLAKYAAGLNSQPIGCVNTDSDGDGYVACSVGEQNLQTGKVEVVKILCNYRPLTSGCKLPDVQINPTTTY